MPAALAERKEAHADLLASSEALHTTLFQWYSSIPLHFPKKLRFTLLYKYSFFHVPILPGPIRLPFFFS